MNKIVNISGKIIVGVLILGGFPFLAGTAEAEAAEIELAASGEIHSELSAGAAKELAQAVHSGDTCRLASVHYELKDISDENIVAMFTKCAEAGDARASMWLARLYFKGRCSLPTKKNMALKMAAEAITNVIQQAEAGDREAQFLLGCAYHEGFPVERDFKKAVKWYELAVASGHITAMNNLAALAQKAYGTPPDIKRARRLLAQAAAKGSVLAAENAVKIRGERGDDSERLKTLFKSPLVQALGKQRDDAIAMLVKQGIIADPKKFDESVEQSHSEMKVLLFKDDGLLLIVDGVGRINNVDGYVAGHRGPGQCKSEIPFGVTWTDNAEKAREKLGSPDDSGVVLSDLARGMAYNIGNVVYAVMFNLKDQRTLKVWRVYEKWAVDYPDQKTTTP